jgi:hypothetical protein
MPTVVKILGGYLEVDLGGTGGGGGSPPGIWPSPGHPAHPIAPGGSPPGIWGGAPPYVDIGGPPQQGSGVWPGQGQPSHPIAPGGQPPHPSQGPGFPTHPIFIPPNQPPVDPPEDQSKIEWKSGWTQDQGWITVGIVTPEFPHPTPSGD